jgi:phage repressor protein C with HTH and peptisase S24 domain
MPKGITQQGLADMLGVSIGAVKKWLKGESAPSFEHIKPLSKILGKSVNWVLTGEDTESDTLVSKSANTDHSNYNINIYSVEMAAGNGSMNYEEEVVDSYQLSKDFFDKHSLSPQSAVGVFIKGDSMEPRFRGGDIAVVDISVKHFDTDGIYAFCYDGHCFIKHLQMEGNRLYAISSNQIYNRWAIDEHEYFKIIGMVKAAICKI